MKKIFIFIICLFGFPMISNAACDYNRLTSIINNVNIHYEYTIINNNPQFTITLTNLTNDLMVYDNQTKISYCNLNRCKGRFTNELKITTNKSGSYRFDFYNLSCSGSLGHKTISLPKYNPYYKDELCEGLSNYKQCKRWSGYSADRKTFENDIKEIKEEIERNNKKDEEKIKEGKKWHEIFIEVLLDYWWLFVIFITIIIGLCYFIRLQRKKNEYDFDV